VRTVNFRTCDEGRLIGSQEQYGVGHLVNLSRPAHRNDTHAFGAHGGIGGATGCAHRRHDAGMNRVGADLVLVRYGFLAAGWFRCLTALGRNPKYRPTASTVAPTAIAPVLMASICCNLNFARGAVTSPGRCESLITAILENHSCMAYSATMIEIASLDELNRHNDASRPPVSPDY
jgi:hypothetical protein